MHSKHSFPVPDGYMVIYRPWITLPGGEKIYARHYGKKAFRLIVREV